MSEMEYIKRVTEEYGAKGAAAYEACMREYEAGWDFGDDLKFYNDCINRMWEGDVTALKDMALKMFDCTGNPVFMII